MAGFPLRQIPSCHGRKVVLVKILRWLAVCFLLTWPRFAPAGVLGDWRGQRALEHLNRRLHGHVDDYTQNVVSFDPTLPVDAYLVPSDFAKGGELIQEQACDPSSPACLFPDYPGTIPWKLGLQFERDAPVGVNGEQLTGTAVTDWLNLPPSQ